MPVCCCIGQAAGIAISIAKKEGKNVSEVDAKKIQDILRKNDAFFGEM